MGLIDADETRKKMLNSLDELFENIEMTGKMILQKTLIRTIIHHIDDAQTIDAAPVKRARWIKGKYWDDWFCSGCSNKANLDWRENPILSSFCPHCGAIMYIKDGEGEFAEVIAHHKTELTLQNVNDYSISLNPENIMLVSLNSHADPLPGAVVDREQFNKAANEIGDSDEWTYYDKMALATFVNKLEEKLFGGADE